MELSVIIPTYNRREMLSKTIQTLMDQVGEIKFEVLVCDDGSNDGTEDLVKGYIRNAPFLLRYLFHERNGARYSTTRNEGIRAASYPIIVIIDDDMLLPATILKAHHDTHNIPGIVTIGYRYNLIPNEKEPYLPDVRDKHFAAYPNVEVPIWSIMETCNISLDRELLINVGLFDETFTGWGGEDIELGYRLSKSGAKLVLNKEVYAWHQYDSDPKNSFLRYFRGLKPDFSSQIANLIRFKEKYPEDTELQERLANWIERNKRIEAEMLSGKI